MDNVNTDYELNVFSNSAGTIGQWYVDNVNEERRKDLSLLGDLGLIYGGVNGITKKTANRSGITVLGKYPNYENLAIEKGGNYFKVPDNIWNDLVKTGKADAANYKFLDRAILRNDKFILSDNPLDPSKNTGSFAKEIKYMQNRGYKVSSDGKTLIKEVNK